MSEAINLPEKIDYSLVKFEFETGSTTYTNAVGNKIGPDGLTYRSVPDMDIVMPPNSGTIEARELHVDIPVEMQNGSLDPFIEEMMKTTPFAPITVTLINYIRPTTGGPQTLQELWFSGRLESTITNPEKRSDIVRFIAIDEKGKLEVALGFQCNPECENALGDAGCKINLASSAFGIVGEVTAINGAQMTIVNGGSFSDRMFHRGFVSFEGLNIGIRDWRSAAPTIFHMMRQPPASWLGQNVRFVAGCDKLPGTCASRFSNIANFLGFGTAVPSYNPLTKL